MKRLNIAPGMRFGKLQIVSEAETIKTGKAAYSRQFLCKCDCGKTVECALGNLRKGHTSSCGCGKRIKLRELRLKHGNRFHPLYGVWASMKQRCSNPRSKIYNYYGGRGISVCLQWINSFSDFLNWSIVNGWKRGLEIDRINNDGNYEPSNCRWVDRSTNNLNRRKFKIKERV